MALFICRPDKRAYRFRTRDPSETVEEISRSADSEKLPRRGIYDYVGI